MSRPIGVFRRRTVSAGFVPTAPGWDVTCRLCSIGEWRGGMPTSQERAISLGLEHLRAWHLRGENGNWS